MTLNIIKGVHKRILFFSLIFSLALIPLSIICLINEFSINAVLGFLCSITLISVLTILGEISFYSSEPHEMIINFDKNEVKLIYKKKIKDIKNVISVKPLLRDEKIWFIVIFQNALASRNIEIEYIEDNKTKKIYIGYATKKELKKLNQYLIEHNIPWSTH